MKLLSSEDSMRLQRKIAAVLTLLSTEDSIVYNTSRVIYELQHSITIMNDIHKHINL